MKNKDILEKIKSRRFYLNKIEAKRINKEPEQDTFDIQQDGEYELIENSENKLSIKHKTKIKVNPEALFYIEIEHVIECLLKESISDEQINDNINLLISPLGSEISFLVSILTKEMINSRVILPPVIEVKEEKNK